jgi:hypothetical protein
MLGSACPHAPADTAAAGLAAADPVTSDTGLTTGGKKRVIAAPPLAVAKAGRAPAKAPLGGGVREAIGAASTPPIAAPAAGTPTVIPSLRPQP